MKNIRHLIRTILNALYLWCINMVVVVQTPEKPTEETTEEATYETTEENTEKAIYLDICNFAREERKFRRKAFAHRICRYIPTLMTSLVMNMILAGLLIRCYDSQIAERYPEIQWAIDAYFMIFEYIFKVMHIVVNSLIDYFINIFG